MEKSGVAPNDKRSLPYGGSFAIQDKEIISYIKDLPIATSLWQEDITQVFCQRFVNWIGSTVNNTVSGLGNFPFAVYSNGTSEAFVMFYIKNKNRRFRCFRGEYIYHSLAWRNDWPDWIPLIDLDLQDNDAVVISLPFADTGNTHEHMEELLSMCDRKKIPVLVDCAYFGTTNGIDFNFSHTCITDIAFSLSKAFPVAHARIGMRLSRNDDDDLMFVYDKINYNNRLGAMLGHALLERYSPDYIYNKYCHRQDELCKNLGIEKSSCVLFGLDFNDRYPEYNRGGSVNRLGLHKHLDV